jgi:DNA-binding transcriptional ArsR family regulator
MAARSDPRSETGMVDFVPFFKAFCNPTRAQIMEFLLSGERCVCEMTGTLDQSQPLISHHLALLRDAGFINMRNEGTRSYYSIAWERFDGDLKGFIEYVERLRSAPPNLERTGSACATAVKKPGLRSV